MTKSLGLKAAMAALALVLAGGTAVAQLKAPETKKAAVKKATPSPCAGLEESACKANTACSWFKETTTKKGKRRAHCQKKPTPPAKKAAPKEKK
jgi:hypothetical protein